MFVVEVDSVVVGPGMVGNILNQSCVVLSSLCVPFFASSNLIIVNLPVEDCKLAIESS